MPLIGTNNIQIFNTGAVGFYVTGSWNKSGSPLVIRGNLLQPAGEQTAPEAR